MSKFTLTGPDRENSTFHHIAYFIDGYKEHGYSKRLDRNEPVNKIALLCGTVGRLVPRYLLAHSRGVCYKVEFYRCFRTQTGNAAHKEELILVCEDAGYRLGGSVGTDMFCKSFLQALYKAGLNYPKVEPMLKRYAKNSPLTFDPATESIECLHERCINLIDQGYPKSEVEQFFFSIKRKFFPEPAAPAPQANPEPKRGGEAKSLASLLPNFKQ